jgi:UDP-N-acetylmuramyl tripeptide synthase
VTSTAVMAARAAALLSRGLRLGGGTALPGLVALWLEPRLVARLGQELGQGCLLVTGTNGKTTTARLLRAAARQAGLEPVANGAGSNLMRGVAAALCQAADPLTGHLPQPHLRLGVFEVDEATLPEAARALRPRTIVFTNLFRDQLDRYGEVDRVAGIWRSLLERLDEATTIVLNADDPSVASLAAAARGPLLLYGLGDATWAAPALEHAADARWCPACGQELAYDAVYYGHLGLWRCPGCGARRPRPQVEALRLAQEEGSLRLHLSLPQEREEELRVPLQGLYNAYNVLAALAGALALGLPWPAVREAFGGFAGAFGRQERLTLAGRTVQVALAKNPAGLNQVLRTIAAAPGPHHLALFLNDGIADGQDISWIWDVDFELLRGQVATLLASGTRAADLALRLKYAGLGEPLVEPRTRPALRRALLATPPGALLHVVPTYTALIEVRETLARWGRRPPFWQEG